MAIFQVDPKQLDRRGTPASKVEMQCVLVSRQAIERVRPSQPDTGDFAIAAKRCSTSKCLKHDSLNGLVNPAALAAFTNGLSNDPAVLFGANENMKQNPLGSGPNTGPGVNPVAGRAFAAWCCYSQRFSMPTATTCCNSRAVCRHREIKRRPWPNC